MDYKELTPGMIIMDFNRAKVFKYSGVGDLPNRLDFVTNHWLLANEAQIKLFNQLNKGENVIGFKAMGMDAGSQRFKQREKQEYTITLSNQYDWLKILQLQQTWNLKEPYQVIHNLIGQSSGIAALSETKNEIDPTKILDYVKVYLKQWLNS